MLIVVVSVVTWGQTPSGVSIHYPGYSFSVTSALQGSADGDVVPFVAGKIDQLPKKAELSRFGILYRDDAKNLAGSTVLELVDAASGKVLRKITLDEFYGKTSGTWSRVAEESKASASSIIEAFKFQLAGADARFVKQYSLVGDDALPNSKKVEVSFSIQTTSSLKLKVRMFGKVEGVLVQSVNGFVVTNTEALTSLKPALLFNYTSGTMAQLEVAKKEKKQSFTLTTGIVSVEPNQLAKVLSFDVVGSSISFAEKVPQQVENLRNYMGSKRPAPAVAIVSVPDKQKTSPKDTLAYTIYYHNIGTAPAKDISVNGLIPKGTIYLDGSAEGSGTTISFERKPAAAPAQGEITNVKWNDPSTIKPGEERWVRYKVVVQ
jgi:uncharacterized repeat protein (TIGR01451 family)